MIEVASIVPVPYLDLTVEDSYFLCLAQVIRDSAPYAHFFQGQSREGKFVILDNGAAELGEGLDVHDLCRAAETVEATEASLPDKVCDRGATLKLGEEALPLMSGNGYGLMAIPQGSTPKAWLDCAVEMWSWPVETIGISKFFPGHRYAALHELRGVLGDRLADKEIHLLGTTLEVSTVAMAHEEFGVRGIDSAYAYYYARLGVELPTDLVKERVEAEIDFTNEDVADRALVEANLGWWRSACRRAL